MTDNNIKHFLFSQAVPERSTPRIRAVLNTPDGGVFPAANVTSIRMWLRDIATDAIVNGREAVNVMNANGGTLSDGLFLLQFTQDDTAILGDGASERRFVTLDFQLSGAGRIPHGYTFYIRNFRDITV